MKRRDGEPPRDADNEDVGYGKPPRRTQYKPGQSGNPNGRPPGARSKHKKLVEAMDQPTRAMFMAEMQRPIAVTSGGKKVTMPTIQMITRALAKTAAEGGQQAQRTALMLELELEREAAAQNAECVRLARELKDLSYEVIARYRARGLPPPPELLPHPDDIFIDELRQRVEIRGPCTPEQKAELDEQLSKRDMWEEDFGWARETYEKVGRTEMGLLNALLSQNNFDIINVSLPERYRKTLEGRLPNPIWRETFLSWPKRKRRELQRRVPAAVLEEIFGVGPSEPS